MNKETVFLLLIPCILAFPRDPSKRDETGYVEYRPGTLNVILAAPHGGGLEPSEIPTRDFGCWDGSECIWRHDCGEKDESRCRATTVRDSWTLELTELMRDDIYELFGEYPTTVINLLHRRKFDANRDIGEATFGVPIVEQAWHEFHDYIDQSKEAFDGPGLFLDIHGHGHPEQWAELGYLISGSNLDNDNLDPDTSSIRNLFNTVGGDFDELLRGDTSYGKFLQDEGFDSVPGPEFRSPDGGGYFSGGYNTRRHGSRDGGQCDAIQIESPSSFRAADNREAYSRGLSAAVYEFMTLHYGDVKKN